MGIKIIRNISVGVDIESIGRFSNLNGNKDKSFFDKVYTKSELDYCYSKKNGAQHLAGRYCAKEAITKALCALGRVDLMYRDIEITNSERGVPEVDILKKGFDDLEISVSISHCEDKAIATAVIYIK